MKSGFKETKDFSKFLKEKQDELHKVCLEEWNKVTFDTKFSKEYGNEKHKDGSVL